VLRSAGPVLALLLAPMAVVVEAQLDASSVRGTVVDEQGRPLPGVRIELEFKGESRTKVVKKATTDKKGGFIYVGLKPGPWTLAFSKDGYATAKVDTTLSGGGLSEIPQVGLAAAQPAGGSLAGALAASGAGAAGAASGDAAPQEERVKQLGASYKKAVDALRAGQHDDAEAQFRALVAELPGLAEAHHNLGYLYSRRGDAAAAEAAFRKAIELQPATSDSYLALATLLGQGKRADEALALLQGAAGSFGADARFQFALGAAAFNIGRSEEAEAAFLKAIELDPGQIEAAFFLGSLALSRNDMKAAIAQLERYVAAAPEGAPNLAPARALLASLKKSK
jgi:predicted Zn-dependent protease